MLKQLISSLRYTIHRCLNLSGTTDPREASTDSEKAIHGRETDMAQKQGRMGRAITNFFPAEVNAEGIHRDAFCKKA